MKRALLSVSDKTGIVELGEALLERGWELLSTRWYRPDPPGRRPRGDERL